MIDQYDGVIERLSPPVSQAIAALILLFPDRRPTWVEIRRVCEVRGSPERPVAAAFGYLTHPGAPETDKFGYTDMLDGSRVPGRIEFTIAEAEVNAAYEYFLWRYPDARRFVSRPLGVKPH